MDRGFELMIPREKEGSVKSIIRHQFKFKFFNKEFKFSFTINQTPE